jgi:hypothetical protein
MSQDKTIFKTVKLINSNLKYKHSSNYNYMYKLSIYSKGSLFFNSLEEIKNKILTNIDFADTLFREMIMLQKTDDNNVSYEISRENTSSQELCSPDFDNVQSNQSKNIDSYICFSIIEWENFKSIPNPNK